MSPRAQGLTQTRPSSSAGADARPTPTGQCSVTHRGTRWSRVSMATLLERESVVGSQCHSTRETEAVLPTMGVGHRMEAYGALTTGPGPPLGPCRPWVEKGAAEPQLGITGACPRPLGDFPWEAHFPAGSPPARITHTHGLPLMQSTLGSAHTHAHRHQTPRAQADSRLTPCGCAPAPGAHGSRPTEPGAGHSRHHSPASLQAQPPRALLVGPGEKGFQATLCCCALSQADPGTADAGPDGASRSCVPAAGLRARTHRDAVKTPLSGLSLVSLDAWHALQAGCHA